MARGQNSVILKNRAQMLYFELAPILLKQAKPEGDELRKIALKNVVIDFSQRMGSTLGLCYPETRKIHLNFEYFSKKTSYLPYTLYHEMVHQFLFDMKKPWHHTTEFYFLMGLFPNCYARDPNVHIHMRQAQAGIKKLVKHEAEEKERKAAETIILKESHFGEENF